MAVKKLEEARKKNTKIRGFLFDSDEKGLNSSKIIEFILYSMC